MLAGESTGWKNFLGLDIGVAYYSFSLDKFSCPSCFKNNQSKIFVLFLRSQFIANFDITEAR